MANFEYAETSSKHNTPIHNEQTAELDNEKNTAILGIKWDIHSILRAFRSSIAERMQSLETGDTSPEKDTTPKIIGYSADGKQKVEIPISAEFTDDLSGVGVRQPIERLQKQIAAYEELLTMLYEHEEKVNPDERRAVISLQGQAWKKIQQLKKELEFAKHGEPRFTVRSAIVN